MDNVYKDLPSSFPRGESFFDLCKTENIRIERIVSNGHSTPATEWYDQTENEWVMVLSGEGKIAFESGKESHLKTGDYINIPKHIKHRVSWTSENEKTIWLAVFYP